MITVITPTGDRPLAFALCQKWMSQQTVQPDQWLVIDDGKIPLAQHIPMEYIRRVPRPGIDPKHTLSLNIEQAIPLITGDKIMIMEDDEYYASDYIEEMSRRLEEHEIIGIGCCKYYYLPTRGYYVHHNMDRASLAETAFRSSFLPEFIECLHIPRILDQPLWEKLREVQQPKAVHERIRSPRHPAPPVQGRIIPSRAHVFIDRERPVYIGIKGLPGRPGMGSGHDPRRYRTIDSREYRILRAWAPRDYQVYVDFMEHRLTTENYCEYFGWKKTAPETEADTVIYENSEFSLGRVSEIEKEIDELKLDLGQNRREFRIFLEFVAAYFRDRGIERPVVVELGVYDNCQKRFYERALNAEHIGIDIGFLGKPACIPDIKGNTHHPETLERLKEMLCGRPIDLLFIDANHEYNSVRPDYEIYAPLTKHLIAFHDIVAHNIQGYEKLEVYQYWAELLASNKRDMFIEFKNYNDYPIFQGYQMGIGLIIKRDGDEANG